MGELRLMTLGNQGSSQLQMGGSRNRAPPSPNRDEVPCLDWEGPHQLREELYFTNAALFIIQRPSKQSTAVAAGEAPPSSSRDLLWMMVFNVSDDKQRCVCNRQLLPQLVRPLPVQTGHLIPV